MYTPAISVIIPCYNVEKYIDRCVNSVVNQTFNNLEIILVDDKSPDDTPKKCDEWEKKDTRIKVVHKTTNEGLGFARNTGLEIAKGEYVAFLDSDDFLDLEAYEVLYKESKEKDLDICYYKRRRVNEKGDFIEVCKGEEGKLFVGRDNVMQHMLNLVGHLPSDSTQRMESVSVCMGLFRRSIIENNKCRFPSERIVASEDLLFDLDLYPHLNNVEILPNVFYNYFINTSSITQTYNEAKRDRMKKLIDSVKLKLSKLYPYEVYKGHYYSQVLRIYRIILRFESLSDKTLREKMLRIRKECKSSQLIEMFMDPITSDYPFKTRLYIWAMKHSLSLFFIVLYSFKKK